MSFLWSSVSASWTDRRSCKQVENGRFLVTGGSAGIGKAVIRKLVANEFGVINVSRREPDIDSTLLESIQFDLSDLDQIEGTLKNIIRSSQLNGAVLCHGYGDFGCLEQFSTARIRRLVDTNLTSHILLSRLLVPVLKTAGNGNLVFIGSEAALQGGRQGAVYSASKFGLRGLVQSLRHECSRSGVRVSLVNPGMVDTEFFEDLSFAPGENKENALTAEDVAGAILSIIEAPSHAVIDEINLSPLKTVVRHR